ncbi:hypothetical protein LPJ68_004803, partial [Coemansia sp. RSA 1086]
PAGGSLLARRANRQASAGADQAPAAVYRAAGRISLSESASPCSFRSGFKELQVL